MFDMDDEASARRFARRQMNRPALDWLWPFATIRRLRREADAARRGEAVWRNAWRELHDALYADTEPTPVPPHLFRGHSPANPE